MECRCPFTLANGYHEVTRFVSDCPAHGMVVDWLGEESVARILDTSAQVATGSHYLDACYRMTNDLKDIYEPSGICEVCKTWHRIGERGNCGKG